MNESAYYIGNTPIRHISDQISGEYTEIKGEVFYKIENYDGMRPFFMTIVSSTNHWMFIASNGGLTAGRKNSDSALFPYYTDDKIIDGADITGSKTILHVQHENKRFIWEPFSTRQIGAYKRKRNIYKNKIGNKVLFEEINEDLSLKFSYQWTFSDKYGFVKKASIENIGETDIVVGILDGVQNLLPYGVQNDLQEGRSTLADAYKKAELEQDSGVGIFSLSAMIVDKAEPSEALKATIVWSIGLPIKNHLLSSVQLDKFRKGDPIQNETDVRAERGAFFINSELKIPAKSSQTWMIVADVNQNVSSIVRLKKEMLDSEKLISQIDDEQRSNTLNLAKKVALADGIQLTNDPLSTGRHFSNVLFNIMRGGIFEDQYNLDVTDLKDYVNTINKVVAEKNSAFLESLPLDLNYVDAINLVQEEKDLDLERIFYEYLPLSFSRRHGDPSRPWNRFTIETHDDEGRKLKYYEGNWRDIFQNWEALAMSYPKFLEGMVSKFVNASTIDGYNPYRITRNGIDWEVIEPDDPWSFIGYWGDHQVIYLLKLLELSNKYNPGRLEELYFKPLSVYANVPYRIKSYDKLVANPSDTIDFDQKIEAEVHEKEAQLGADGKLVFRNSDDFVRANLTEKLLVMLLTKLYNFVPGAGIWLNTQRPEWNDANNALVGNGASMVTLFYLRRFLLFYRGQLKGLESRKVEINQPVSELLTNIIAILKENVAQLETGISEESRKNILDELGLAGEKYRNVAYNGFDGSTAQVELDSILELCELGLQFIDDTIKDNQREDGLFHAYNLISFSAKDVYVEHLYEMLEGQVAALTSGYLNAEQSLTLLNNLKQSDLFRADQYSYLLYPDRQLPVFMERNNLSGKFINKSQLAQALLKMENGSLFSQDINLNYHFNSNFHNNVDLVRALEKLKKDKNLTELVNTEFNDYLDAFEKVFNHKAFTGRSGTFYGYEGLGSIYWHMVSKLLLATQETIVSAMASGVSEGITGQLVEHYYEIRAGIGINKSPELYGAFPTDAYSHTPGNAGVQQPGMTGQVKEDIISRWAELGVLIADGCISFNPGFLDNKEFLNEDVSFDYFDIHLKPQAIEIPKDSLAFTFCQVPVVYVKSNESKVIITYEDGSVEEIHDKTLPYAISQELFNRTGKIVSIQCFL
jgi:hypothetical protein